MRVVYTCDIGSIPRGNFGWARCVPEQNAIPVGSSDIAKLVSHLKRDINEGLSIALGFECPLFIPVPCSENDLCKGRHGEGNRSVFAPAGTSVTTFGIHEAAWILRTIYSRDNNHVGFTASSSKWPPYDSHQILFCWEAFVSGDAHDKDHIRDAATATMFFIENEMQLEVINAVTAEQPFSLIQAVALWAGWSTRIVRLHDSVLVIKPISRYDGIIGSV